MAKKLQSYFIYKIGSNRLKREKYNITLPLSEAFENGEVVRLSDCQLLRSIRRITNKKEYNPTLEKALKKLRNNKASKESVKKVREQIESQLFVDSIVYIEFNDARHYEKLITNGLFINGEEFVRLLSSAGNARKKTTMFCKKSIWEDLNYILDCGRDPEYKINPSKFSAYYSLCSSGGLEMQIPRIVIIDDKIVKRMTKVDFVSENPNPLEDPIVEEKEIEIEFNLWDGMALMSRTFANMIADTFELDFTPAGCVFRGSYLKGMMVTFDFKQFSEEYGVNKIIDIWGKSFDVNDVDVILTKSQMKLSGAYSSMEQYLNECKIRDFNWTISRTTPKIDSHTFDSNYQYLQVEDLDDYSIERLAQPTIDYLMNVSGLDWMSVVLFMIGDLEEKNISKEWFESLDPTVKQLLYKPESVNDKYIQNKLRRMLDKQITEACEGKLILNGSYQTMVSDPFGLAQWAFGLEVTGLLKGREFYSSYWNNKNISRVGAMRSPLTSGSEINILDLKNNEDMQKWYFYCGSGIIYNVWDESVLLHAGADFDFDIVATTDNQEIINNAPGGLPITYEKKTAPKEIINKDLLWKSDVRVFSNKIGYLTNLSTTMYSLLAKYNKDDKEYKTLMNRIKAATAEQSMVIDFGKGVEVMPIPVHWSTWQKWNDEDDVEEIELKKYYNTILAEQRPYFMIYTYNHKMKKYKEHVKIYNDYSQCHFGITLNELLREGSNGDTDKQKCIDFYYRYNPIIDSLSTMNKISHFIENKVKVKRNQSDLCWEFDVDAEKLEKMWNLYKVWNSDKSDENQYKYRLLADDISTNSKEIARLALMTNGRFANKVFADEILELFARQTIEIPVSSKNGDKLFCNKKYKIISFNLEE